MKTSMNCDKCGKPVDNDNDAVLIDLILTSNPMLIGARPRHFLPTEDCVGSPSRAQYIEGQPLDDRGYGYYPEYENRIRDAYKEMCSKD